ncbi:uncharacterized protein LOC129774827 [Toxorhynchites rutilus septentrionalis]|uniref:uncharacterized protein LOC129774827 n=1 Tax=Toxorhynchites rutilus septentrionalis TaxID=329112 RepID=UPI0024792AB9|nr:uncharacterized protein LOC129774827 [Toxorhynchites rutilus septentrionalis]
MKIAAVLILVIACTSLTTAKPTLLLKKLKLYALPRLLNGQSSPAAGIAEFFSLPKLPSIYIPYPFSALFKPTEPAPPVIYHTEEETLPSSPIPEVETVPVELPEDLEAPAPVPEELEGAPQVPHEELDTVPHVPQDLPNEIDIRGPVYIAETPGVKHQALLPAGYSHSVIIQNLAPAPGTVG